MTVLPYYRTPANSTVTDNLSYRGYGTVRLLRGPVPASVPLR